MSDTSNRPDPRRNGWGDAQRKPIDTGWLKAIASGVADLFRRTPPTVPVTAPLPSSEPRQQPPWMGPGQAMVPVVPNRADVAGREYDYPFGANMGVQPRRFEGNSFAELKALADNLDVLRLAIETRKDQMGNLTWSCAKRKRPNEKQRQAPDERCAKIEDFFRSPDRRLPWISWVRELVEAQLVIDAPAIYVRRTLGGDVYSLDIVDGATIDVKVDKTGRQPVAPEVAFQQILKGVPAIDYTADELVYWPRNLRPGHRYGMSPVQQVIMTVNIAIRREVAKLAYFTEGNVPEALVSVPKEWTAEQIAQFQTYWDALLADQRERRKLKFVPGDMNFMQTRSDQMLGDATDEWLARVVCYALSLPPLPFVKMMNRATAESSYEAALEEGLQPMIMWAKSLFDHLVQKVFGYEDLEMVPDDIRKIDPAEQEMRDIQLIRLGRKSIDEVRIAAGEEPIGMEHAVFGIGPMGLMFVKDILKAREQGMMMPQPAMPPDAMGGMPGAPGMAGTPQLGGGAGVTLHPSAAPLLEGLNPRLLNAVGLGAAGKGGRRIDVTQQDEFDSDPLSNVVAHPNVLKTLREAEARQGRRATR